MRDFQIRERDAAGILQDLSTELLLQLRERFRSGRARFHAMVAGLEWMQECER